MAAYLEASIEESDGDAAFVAKALGDIARARGMAQVASDAGLSRESLCKALSGERVPTFETVSGSSSGSPRRRLSSMIRAQVRASSSDQSTILSSNSSSRRS